MSWKTSPTTFCDIEATPFYESNLLLHRCWFLGVCFQDIPLDIYKLFKEGATFYHTVCEEILFPKQLFFRIKIFISKIDSIHFYKPTKPLITIATRSKSHVQSGFHESQFVIVRPNEVDLFGVFPSEAKVVYIIPNFSEYAILGPHSNGVLKIWHCRDLFL